MTMQQILLLLVLVSAATAQEDRFIWTEQDEEYTSSGYVLVSHTIAEYQKIDLLSECAYKCHQDPRCQSFNFRPDIRRCQLNNGTDLDYPGDFRESAEQGIFGRRDTYEINPEALGLCATRPCENDGYCLDIKDSEGLPGFICVCTEGWAGQDCTAPAGSLAWSDWEDWGTCSVSCGSGWQMRNRACMDAEGHARQASECLGADVDIQMCTMNQCPRWSVWGDWGECSTYTTCGRGFKSRNRNCLHDGVSGVDRLCQGPTNETAPCDQPACDGALRLVGAGDDVWGDGIVEVFNSLEESWGRICSSDWDMDDANLVCTQLGFPDGASSASYAASSALTPAPFFLSGMMCSDSDSALLSCSHDGWMPEDACVDAAGVQCIVSGVWSNWSDWGECSVTCADGQQQRTRLCDQPPPLNGGTTCPGLDADYKDCTMPSCAVDAYWNQWADWGQCNQTCGVGGMSRSRTCHEALHGGETCQGAYVDYSTCNEHDCPVDGYWQVWSDWAECSVSCGGGQQERNRDCEMPLHGGEGCDGEGNEIQDCNTHECPVNCTWNEWTDWQTCSVSCGLGDHSRTRTENSAQYGGEVCEGDVQQTQDCFLIDCPVDCVWQEWQEWARCNERCGPGNQQRLREMDGPLHNGELCVGPLDEWQECTNGPCAVDGEWMPWLEWATCSESCGTGSRTRLRECNLGQHGGSNCTGVNDDTEECFIIENCPVDGVWNDWEDWGTCSVSCDEGTHVRTRTCDGPFYNGAECDGPTEESDSCFVINCPVDGFYLNWETWSACSVSCADGSRSRSRLCVEPQYDGLACEGGPEQDEVCEQPDCPVDGAWSIWTDWTECSLTCGAGGSQSRERTCQGVQHGGDVCPGDDEETQECFVVECPVDGFYLNWETWSACSVSCADGSRSRSRLCVEPQYEGLPCDGPTDQQEDCQEPECPVDGIWLNWSTWGDCTVSCGGGTQPRGRLCDGPYFNGVDCDGETDESQECNDFICPVDGIWLNWSSWSDCSVECGDGTNTRSRMCIEPVGTGAPCTGEDTDSMDCSINCFEPGEWLEWDEFSLCSVTCGGGLRNRERECDLTTNGEYTSPCEGEATEGVTCHDYPCEAGTSNGPHECSELKKRGLEDSFVPVQVQGWEASSVVWVMCDLDAENGVGATLIGHNHMDPVFIDGAVERGNFKLQFEYGLEFAGLNAVDLVQAYLEEVRDFTLGCRQRFSWSCVKATLFNPLNTDISTTFWSNDDITQHYYYDGSDESYRGCACGKTSTCVNPSTVCNCDADDAVTRLDEGYIQGYDLPIKFFEAGMMDQPGEYANLTIGPLECWGQSDY